MSLLITVSIIILSLFCSLIKNEAMYYSCPSDWTLVERVVPRCYQPINPILRSNLSSRCKTIGGIALNIDSYDIALEVIEIMKRNSIYGVWLDVVKNNAGYKWIDGRSAPNPLTWCDDVKQKEDNLVLVCPYPKYGNFSTSTCCISDRQSATEWAGICKTFVLRSCLYRTGRQLRPDSNLFKFLGSRVMTEFTGAIPESECCKYCTITQYCTAFNYIRDKKICEFYQALQSTNVLNSQTLNTASKNIVAGTFAELG